MTRLGSFVRRDERSTRRIAKAAVHAVDAVNVPEPISNAALRGLDSRARRAGASDELIALADAMSASHGIRVRIATLRLLARVGSGDSSALTPLLNKLPPNPEPGLLWDVMSLAGYDTDSVRGDDAADLVTFFEPEIRRSFHADGYSQVFEWLLDNGEVTRDSNSLRPLLEHLVTGAIEYRHHIETATPSFERYDLISVMDALESWPHTIVLCGPSLLAATKPQSAFGRFGQMELATFAALDDVLADMPDTFRLLDRRGGHVGLLHLPSNRSVTLVGLVENGEHIVHGDGRFTRWHNRFEVIEHQVGDLQFLGPVDVDRYLDERFGDWQRNALFYDPLLDAPNTSVNRSLDGLLFVYFQLRNTFEAGTRHFADEWAAIMRDRFGIDYSNFVPRGVPRKVLATPVTADEVGGRQIRLVVAPFDGVDAAFVAWLEAQRDDDVFLVAAVTGHRLDVGTNERLALANSLRSIDHATLIESEDDLLTPIAGVEVTGCVEYPADRSGAVS